MNSCFISSWFLRYLYPACVSTWATCMCLYSVITLDFCRWMNIIIQYVVFFFVLLMEVSSKFFLGRLKIHFKYLFLYLFISIFSTEINIISVSIFCHCFDYQLYLMFQAYFWNVRFVVIY